MSPRTFLDWPFFTSAHKELAERVNTWAVQRFASNTAHAEDRASVDAACRQLVRDLGRAGWTQYSAPPIRDGATPAFDVRALALIRETLAWHDGLADFSFAMQGLGSGAISLAGSPELR
jgi:acyl-CoA dehydrogenase